MNDSEPTTLIIAVDIQAKMMNLDTLRTILGVIGNVTSFFLFASPLLTIWRIWKKESAEEFKFHSLHVGMMYCIMWVFYSMPFVQPGNILITTINSVGLVMYIIYNIIYYIYSVKKIRRSMVLHYIVGFVFLAGLMWSSLVTFDSLASRSNFVGFFCDFFAIILYDLDLIITVKALRSKTVKVTLLPFSLICLLNGVVWSAYALTRFDPYILIGNGIGALVGCIQLLLYAGYCCVERFRPTRLSPVDDC